MDYCEIIDERERKNLGAQKSVNNHLIRLVLKIEFTTIPQKKLFTEQVSQFCVLNNIFLEGKILQKS